MTDLDLPRLSSSEETSFKTCRLAHLFGYGLGYAPVVTNRKLSTGSWFHAGTEAFYKGDSIETALQAFADKRWAELKKGGVSDKAEQRLYFIKDRDLVKAMVDNYIKWVRERGLDDDYETVEVEEKHYITIPGAATVLPVKMDLLQRHRRTGALRPVDFKTAASFGDDLTKYQLSEQNGNYQLAIFAKYEEVPEGLQYREARKMAPQTNPRSKSPYFRDINIVLTRAEMLKRAEDYIAISHEVTDPDRTIYANPGSCCGSWKNDWQAPCLLVHQGYDPQDALEASTAYAPKDPYERYKEETEE